MRSVNLTIESIETALSRAEECDSPALVIRSEVPEVFCSGINLKLGAAERAALSDRLYALYERFIVSPVIVVTEVCGIAVGGGVQLCLAADICMVYIERFIPVRRSRPWTRGRRVGAVADRGASARGRTIAVHAHYRWGRGNPAWPGRPA